MALITWVLHRCWDPNSCSLDHVVFWFHSVAQTNTMASRNSGGNGFIRLTFTYRSQSIIRKVREGTQAGTEAGWCTVLCSAHSLITQNHVSRDSTAYSGMDFPISISCHDYACIDMSISHYDQVNTSY